MHPTPTNEEINEFVKMVNPAMFVNPVMYGNFLYATLRSITQTYRGYSVLVPQLEVILLRLIQENNIPSIQLAFAIYLMETHPTVPEWVHNSVELMKGFPENIHCIEAIGCALSPLTPIVYHKDAKKAASTLMKVVRIKPLGSLEYARLLYNGIGIKKDKELAKSIVADLPPPYNEMELPRANSGPKSAFFATLVSMGAIIGGIFFAQKFIEWEKNHKKL